MSESILAHNVPPMKSSPGETLRGALNNEELQSLLQRHNLDVNLLKRSIPSGTSSKSKIERPEYATRYTADDVMRNYRRLLPISPNIVDFPKVFPELADKSPAETITALAKRFKKNPTVNNSSLLQAAINKFSATRGGGSQSVKRAIGEAKKLFHRPNPGGDNTALDDIWFNAFVDENYGGGSLFLDMPQGFSSMGFSYVGSGFNDKLTSLQCGCFTTEVGGYVILFQDAGFSNNYLKYTLTGSSPGNSIGVPNVGKSFNDQTSSIMMIRRFPDELGPFSFASFVPPGSITDIVNGMSPNVSTNGDPIYTWDLWPNGANYHPNDPFKQFVYIRVPISYNPFQYWSGSYPSELRYWIYLYVDGNGLIQGYVDWGGHYVQSGPESGTIGNTLDLLIENSVGQVNGLISEALSFVNAVGKYDFLYYLPGLDDASGNTNDGVSVVMVETR